MIKAKKFGVIALVAFMGLMPALEAAGRFGFGVQGDFAFANHWSTEEKSGGYTVESGIKGGFGGGALAMFRINDLFSLEADILYVKKGSNQTISIPGYPYGDIKVKYPLDYVEIPLLLRANPLPRAKIQPSLAVGPYMAFQAAKKYS